MESEMDMQDSSEKRASVELTEFFRLFGLDRSHTLLSNSSPSNGLFPPSITTPPLKDDPKTHTEKQNSLDSHSLPGTLLVLFAELYLILPILCALLYRNCQMPFKT